MMTVSLFLVIVATLRSETAPYIGCLNAYQCVGDQLITNSSGSGTGTIKSWGYKSSSSNQSSIDSDETVRCYGAFSCFDSSFIKSLSSTFCTGSNSCGSSLINNIGSADTFCTGSNSCHQSDLITAGADIECRGDQSCAYTNINIQNTANIRGWGAYSMMYTNIITPNTNALIDIKFYGYMAGYGANITCQSTDRCNIRCSNNACYSIYIDCRGDCSIINESNSAILTINSVIYFINEASFELIYNSQTLTTNADNQCNQQPNSIKYDNYRGNYQGADIIGNGGPICCRGYYSCTEVNKIQLNNANQHAIVCSGSNGCSRVGSIISNGHVLCDGEKSCSDTNIMTTDDIHCFGAWSCRSVNISGATNIYCSGYQSCLDISIQSSGDINIYLLGWESGLDMTLNCNVGDECKTFCQGLDGCITTSSTTIHYVSPLSTTYTPSSSPTIKPSVSPLTTTYTPSQSPVDLKTLSSPSFHSGKEVNNPLYWIIIIISSIAALCIIIGIVFYYKNRDKHRDKKERRKKQMLISNPMVILIAVGIYDDYPKDTADELANVYLRNLDIDRDIEHLHGIFGKDMLNYNISPHYTNPLIPSLYWTQKEIINLLKSKAKELDKNDEYDGLIVVISSHGIASHICCSDYRLISKVAIHRLFTTNYKRAREIPRIFLYDGCEGNEERDGYFGGGSSPQSKQGKPFDIKGKPPINKINDNKEDGEDEENKNDGVESKEEEYAKTFTETHIVQKYGTIWARNTRSVDYKLTQIHAANPGFQAKCSSDLGSYMLYEFVKTIYDDLKQNNGKTTKFIGEIIDEIQAKLENDGKQHIVATFNDMTRPIIFTRNNKKQIESNIEIRLMRELN